MAPMDRDQTQILTPCRAAETRSSLLATVIATFLPLELQGRCVGGGLLLLGFPHELREAGIQCVELVLRALAQVRVTGIDVDVGERPESPITSRLPLGLLIAIDRRWQCVIRDTLHELLTSFIPGERSPYLLGLRLERIPFRGVWMPLCL